VNGVERQVSNTDGSSTIDGMPNTSSNLHLTHAVNIDGDRINLFEGKLDDPRLYSRPLKSHEVFQLYQWGTRGRDMRKLTVNARGDQ
jgi:hypothetical protein